MAARCAIPGCEQPAKSKYTGKEQEFCMTHWFQLPLAMRRRVWGQTDYGKRPVPKTLLIDCVSTIKAKES